MDIDSMAAELLERMEGLQRHMPHKMIHHFSQGELFLLNHLRTADGVARPSEMSRAMGTSTARVAAALNSMERKGWVRREVDAADHRKTLVHITPEGLAFASSGRERLLFRVRQLLEALGEEDAAAYLRILTKIGTLAAVMDADSTEDTLYMERNDGQ